ncbi:hypothetical protein HK103_003015 [Boothiomyces macroporosus]|uniref:Transmembrane protein 198 n=1 Tax=Boothiomyces macroporosus TaxID=261099 RepID=A0AAD5UM28_9FUNG|nr:hypothetical protein HK103_003015 [Boothiomyces macroporosus]
MQLKSIILLLTAAIANPSARYRSPSDRFSPADQINSNEDDYSLHASYQSQGGDYRNEQEFQEEDDYYDQGYQYNQGAFGYDNSRKFSRPATFISDTEYSGNQGSGKDMISSSFSNGNMPGVGRPSAMDGDLSDLYEEDLQKNPAFIDRVGDITTNMTDGKGNTTTVGLNPLGNISSLVRGIILVILGPLILFTGKKALKPILFISGAFIFGILTAYIIAKSNPTLSQDNYTLSLGITIASALVGGCIFLCLFAFSFLVFGALVGFLTSIFILQWGFATNLADSVRILIIVGFIIVGIFAAVLAKDYITMIATSVLGSFFLFSGIDEFFQTGFNSVTRSLINKEAVTYSTNTYLMLGGFLLLSALGVGFQFYQNRKKAGYDKVSKV